MSITQSRRLRKEMTPPERRLWTALRTRPDGFRFRRQRPHDPFSFDFFCVAAALAIEVDGLAHELGDNPARDQRRDGIAARHGVKTIRFRATDIRDELQAVVTAIIVECEQRTPPSSLRDATSP